MALKFEKTGNAMDPFKELQKAIKKVTKKVTILKKPEPFKPRDTNMTFETFQKKIIRPKQAPKIHIPKRSLKPEEKIPHVPLVKPKFKDISKPRYKKTTLKPKGGKHGLKWNFGNTPGGRSSKS